MSHSPRPAASGFRPATEADRPAIEALLRRRVETSMFPLGNLLDHGMAGGHPRAMSFVVSDDPGPSPLLGLVGITEAGMVMPQIAPPRATEAATELARTWPRRPVAGIVGEAEQARAMQAALGLGAVEASLDADEPLMSLDLARLAMPTTEGLALAPWSEERRALLVAWRAAYGREVLGWGEDAEGRAAREVDGSIKGHRFRLLLRGGEPVASTGFGARVEEAVQVAGVWTPPPLRGQGLARAAVALHLAEARAQGVRRAILSASSEAAVRAYRALGFREVGRFTLLLFREPQMAGEG